MSKELFAEMREREIQEQTEQLNQFKTDSNGNTL